MVLPDGTTLMHGTKPYDPKKAHEYYLRTRKLKGRKKVSPEVAALAKRLAGMSDEEIHSEIQKSKNPAEVKLIKIMLGNRQRIHGGKGPAKAKATPEQKQAAAQRVASIRSELADLNNRLKDAVAKAHKAKIKAKRGPTAADKSKAARDSKQYRSKHKQKLASKRTAANKDKASGKTRADSVSAIKFDIAETRGKLQKAIERQKALG